MGSSMGLWEYMLAFSRVQKQRRDEQVAAQKTDWERQMDLRKLDMEQQRVDAARLPYEQPKAQTDYQREYDRQRALLTAARKQSEWDASFRKGAESEANIGLKGAQQKVAEANAGKINTMTPLQALTEGSRKRKLDQETDNIKTLAPTQVKLNEARAKALAEKSAGGTGTTGDGNKDRAGTAQRDIVRDRLKLDLQSATNNMARFQEYVYSVMREAGARGLDPKMQAQIESVKAMHQAKLEAANDEYKRFELDPDAYMGSKTVSEPEMPTLPEGSPIGQPTAQAPAVDRVAQLYSEFQQRAATMAPEALSASKAAMLKALYDGTATFASWPREDRLRFIKLLERSQ